MFNPDGDAAGSIFPYISNVILPVQENTSKGYRDVEELLFKKKSYRRGEVYSFYISFILKDGGETFAYHIPGRNFKAIGGNITEVSTMANVGLGSVGTIPMNTLEVVAANPNAKVFQYSDTSYIGLSATTTGYWHNENEYYPNTDDFDVWSDRKSTRLNSSHT
jgi:hypothetical protein